MTSPAFASTSNNVASKLRVAIVGASLGGLSAANVLHRLGAKVDVFESFPAGFAKRGGALGSVDTELLREIRGGGRESVSAIRGHGHFYGDLWQFLYDGLPPERVHFGYDLMEILNVESSGGGEKDATPQLVFAPPNDKDFSTVKFDLVIGADGGRSTVRPYVTDETPKYAGYTVWRGFCPMEGIDGPPSGRKMVNGVHYETLGFPVRGFDNTIMWNCGVYMAMPEEMVERPVKNRQVGASAMKTVPEWFVPFTRECFGESTGKFWDECVRKGKVSPHAVWEMAADRVVNGRVVLLGDAAHMASPRTGAGAYTAMVDAVMLGRAFAQSTDVEAALRIYNDDTVMRGKKLFASSRRAASGFAPLSHSGRGQCEMAPEEVLQLLQKKSRG
jgi:2-polyprenyl-6-methoxyphenol hydroxylase-like FAD-dependent oxidoreductase